MGDFYKRSKNTVNESWLMELFDICSCKYPITEERMFRGKVLCLFEFESSVYLLQIKLLLDQISY